MSILSELAHGRIDIAGAIAKVIPFIAHAIDDRNDTPTAPDPANGTPEQAETLKDIIQKAVHAYLTAKLGDGFAEVMAEKAADAVLVNVANLIEGALHGADAAKSA